MKTDGLEWMRRAERGIYWVVGIGLVVSAAIYLGYALAQAVQGYISGAFVATTIGFFDRSLMALMLAQIVYTTVAFLQDGVLRVEPVLVVGIIAVVRRILVLTAVAGGMVPDLDINLSFQQTMLELGLLSFIVLVLASAIYLIRKRET